MKKNNILLCLYLSMVLSAFSQEPINFRNRYYFFAVNNKSEIINNIKVNIPKLKSISVLGNSDFILIETKNKKQVKQLKKLINRLGINLKQDVKLPYLCTTSNFIASDSWNDMGYWNSLNQNILKEKQLMDSIYWLVKENFWNNANEINETVDFALSEIPNGSHSDIPSISNVGTWDYYRNSTIDYANATSHGSETAGVAFAKINNASGGYNGDMVGMTNVKQPMLKNIGIDANFSSKVALLSAMQAAINETATSGRRQILSISAAITTGTDTDYDLMFSLADNNGKVLFIIAAGNDGNPIGTTLSNFHSSVIVVQASDGLGNKASFSTYNAPLSFKGTGMRGLALTGTTGTVSWQGTSASAPGVAGATHLLWSLMPTKTAAEIRSILVDSLNTTTFITNPSNAKTPALRIGYLIQNLHFDILHDYRDSVSISSNGGVANLNTSVHDIQGGTIGNPIFWYQKNQTGSWIQIPGGILNKADLGIGTHFLKLEFDILHQVNKCTQIIRPIKLFASTVYTFIGNGNWSVQSNWLNGITPPTNLTNGAEIVINPITGGECILDINQTITTNSKLTVLTGKNFRIKGNLNMQ